MRLLVTRPEPESARTAAALRQRGHAVIEAPMLRIAPVPDVVLGPGPWVAVALTSINAVAAVTANHWAEALAGRPASSTSGWRRARYSTGSPGGVRSAPVGIRRRRIGRRGRRARLPVRVILRSRTGLRSRPTP